MSDNPFLGLAARKRAIERRAFEEDTNVAGRWQAQVPLVREVLGQFGESLFPGSQVTEGEDRVLLRESADPSAAVLVDVALAYDELKRKIGFLVARPHRGEGQPTVVRVEALRGALVQALIQLHPEWH